MSLLLGDGVRLFDQLATDVIELEPMRVVTSPTVTHLKLRGSEGADQARALPSSKRSSPSSGIGSQTAA